jgi:hypothetical protein
VPVRGFALAVVTVAGCAQLVGIRETETGSGGPTPPPIDGAGSGRGSASCGSTVIPNACALLASGMAFDLTTNAKFDTDSGTLVVNGQAKPVTAASVGDIEVIVATTFRVGSGAVLVATGTRTLGVLASDQISIEGTIDVGSHVAAVGSGPGSRTAMACAAQAGGDAAANVNIMDGAGGGGGGFRGGGGNGGAVIVSAMANPDGGSSGVGSVVCPGMPIGGCPGGSGGLGTSTPAAFGGPGGGALYMTSQMGVSIAASGALTAGGAGGAGGLLGTAGNQGGGGGGGVGFIRIPLDFTGSGYTLSPDPCP